MYLPHGKLGRSSPKGISLGKLAVLQPAGCVREQDAVLVLVQAGGGGVPRQAWLRPCQHALAAQQLVHQGALALRTAWLNPSEAQLEMDLPASMGWLWQR